MPSFVPTVKGSVKIEVIINGEVVDKQESPNTLVLEAPKIMLGNLIGPQMTGNDRVTFSNSDTTRPQISAGGIYSPDPRLSVNYLQLGYVEDPSQVNPPAVSANDTALASELYDVKKLTGVEVGEYSLQFICSFEVTNETANRNYYEAALLCPALKPYVSMGMPLPDTDSSEFDILHQVMFAHQTHTPIQASSGSTIRYTWTISMQEPSDS